MLAPKTGIVVDRKNKDFYGRECKKPVSGELTGFSSLNRSKC